MKIGYFVRGEDGFAGLQLEIPACLIRQRQSDGTMMCGRR